MIFVTVGTHEQQFDRLIKEVDYLKKENLIQDEVFIQ
ncbi:TPA: multidrug MFS transporter, partial [Streptococcus pneumoniae]|nr:multidrug MFS transporter [Streptococcus pneumoniae]